MTLHAPSSPSRLRAWLTSRVDQWLDHLCASDERYACGTCDNRFANREAGIAHLERCHPEFVGVAVYEGAPRRSSVQVRPVVAPAF